MAHLDVVVSLPSSVLPTRRSSSLAINALFSRSVGAFLSAAILAMLCAVPAVTAQTLPPVTTQGMPPFSLVSNAGGGIDSINLGNLGILLTIPINSNGIYGPKSSAALMMESGFPLVLSGSKLLIGNYQPFHLQTPIASPASFSSGICSGSAQGVIDATGAYHQTPWITLSCNATSFSAPGSDGWQIVAYPAYYAGNIYIPPSFSAIAPDGTYTAQNPIALITQNTLVANQYDLHQNQTTYTHYYAQNGEWLKDAAVNLTASTVANSGPPSQVYYPGPGGQNSTYNLGWNTWTVNANANCGAYHSWYQNQESANFLTSLQLPDSSYYYFGYEYYWGSTTMYTGRIKSITLPTGATITYSYSGGTNGNGVWCDDGSAATITKITPDGTWVFTHCEYGLATYPTTCNTSAPSGWSTNHLATTTVTAPSGDYKIYTTISYIPSDPSKKIVLPVQEQSFGVTGPGCSVSSPCNLGTQGVCYSGYLNYPACLNPGGVDSGAITERDIYTSVPGIAKPSLTVYKADSYERNTDVFVYDFGGTRSGTNWDTHTQTTYGSWNGSSCQNVTGYYFGSSGLPYQVMNRVCSKQLFVGGGTTPVSTSYYTYNSTGDLITQQDTIGGILVTTASNSYDSFGRLTSSTGPNGEKTVTAYNECSGQEPSSTTVTTEPNGNYATTSLTTNYTSYDCTGERLLVKQDPNGNNWTTSYTGDPFWRPTSTTDPLGNVVNYIYTKTTKEVKQTVVSGSVQDTLTQVDSMGRQQLTEVNLENGNYSITATTYDSNGRVKTQTVPYTGVAGTLSSTAPAFTFTYDGLDRPLTEVGPLYSSTIPGTTKTYAYNKNDTTVTVSPAPSGENAKSTQTEVNGLGRVTSVCEITSGTGYQNCQQAQSATGFLTTYSYYPGGKLNTITQNVGGTTTQLRTFTYDNSNTGRQLTATTPESGTNTTVYDSDPGGSCFSFIGLPVKTADNAGNGLCYSYDLADRLTGIGQATANGYGYGQAFYYDSSVDNTLVNCPSAPNQEGMLAEAHTYLYEPDLIETLSDEVFCYDQLGRPTALFQAAGVDSTTYTAVTESYFPNGLVQTLSVPTQPTITYGLDSLARPYLTTASSGLSPVLTSATYYDNGLPNVMTLGTSDTSTYTYYSNLQPFTATHTIGTGTNNTISHTLTPNSNGTIASLATSDGFYSTNSQTCTFKYDDLERIISDNCGTTHWNQTYSFDPFGNVTTTGSAPWPTSGTYTQSNNRYSSSAFVYDADGRLTNDTFDTLAWDTFGNLASQSGTNFTYDAFDRPVMAGTTKYLYAPDGSLVATENSSGSIVNMFVPLPMGRAVYNAGTLEHYDRYDWQGSARVASTPARTVYSDTSYDAFGIPYWSSGTANKQYAGLNSDISSGTEQVSLTRRYHPTQGRWISPDSIIPNAYNPQSFNAYHYALNQPTNVTDQGGQDDGGGCDFCIPFFGDVYMSDSGSVMFQPWSIPGDAFNIAGASGIPDNAVGTWGLLSQNQFGGITYTPWGRFDSAAIPELAEQGAVGGGSGGGGGSAFGPSGLQISQSYYTPFVPGSGINGFANWGRDNLGNLAYALQPCKNPQISCQIVYPVSGPGMRAGVFTASLEGTTTLERVNQFAGALSQIQRERFITIAVTETAEGVRIVSSSEGALRPTQLALLKEGEIAVTGTGHAEQIGITAAREMGLKPTGVAASRGICRMVCQPFLVEQGVVPLSPLQK
jgi:RHS repeat-associated protein